MNSPLQQWNQFQTGQSKLKTLKNFQEFKRETGKDPLGMPWKSSVNNIFDYCLLLRILK